MRIGELVANFGSSLVADYGLGLRVCTGSTLQQKNHHIAIFAFYCPLLPLHTYQRSNAQHLVEDEKQLPYEENENRGISCNSLCFILFDLILYVHSTIFQLCGTGLPGLNQY